MLSVTLAEIKKHDPCDSGLETLIEANPGCTDDTVIELTSVVDSNGIRDTFWLLRRVVEPEQFKQIIWRFLPICEDSLKFFEAKYPDDKRPRAVYDLLRRQIAGEAISADERLEKRRAAYAAYATAYASAANTAYASAANTAYASAANTAYAAYAAAYAADAYAAYAAADAADAAAYAADAYAAAAYAADAAAYADAGYARQKQAEKQKAHLKAVIVEVLR